MKNGFKKLPSAKLNFFTSNNDKYFLKFLLEQKPIKISIM